MNSEMEELIRDFVSESLEMLEDVEKKFISFEHNDFNKEDLHDIFRSIHTIKGAAGFLGFQNLVNLSHTLENMLKKMRDSELTVTADRIDLALEATTAVKELIQHISKTGKDERDVTNLIEKLQEEIQKKDALGDNEKKDFEIEKDSSGAKSENEKNEHSGQDDHEKIDFRDSRIRVDVDRLDSVFNLVGELVLGKNRLQKIIEGLVLKYSTDQDIITLSETMEALSGFISDLQTDLMKIRMQPIKKIFNKFPSMVRNMARKRGKDILFHIHGEETEVDKSVIEHIGDPLVHLIRNAIDHGIETTQERLSKGKSPQGNITLRAYHEGNNIVIEVHDDGRGIDIEKVRQKAVQMGLVSASRSMELSDEEIIEFIFAPGFTTTEEVTDISGRGVGMDVVNINLQKINGSIYVKTVPEKGTTFFLILPLTLAIINSLLVSVGNETYAIPLANVREVVRTEAKSIKRVNKQDALVIREEVVPLINLSKILDVPGSNGLTEEFYTIIVNAREESFGIAVDRLIGQEEVVLKTVEGEIVNFSDDSFIAGATIIGDGSVVLILDITMLYEHLKKGVKYVS